MKGTNTIDSLDVQGAKQAVLEHLQREWPNSMDLTSRTLVQALTDRAFQQAVSELREDGFIVYEALLLSSLRGYRLVDAALTRRGQLHMSETV